MFDGWMWWDGAAQDCALGPNIKWDGCPRFFISFAFIKKKLSSRELAIYSSIHDHIF